MTDKDPKGTAQDNPERPEDEVERLSKDEKMAFEKIISEIGDSSDTPDAVSESAESKDPPSGELDDEQQAALDNIMAEINADAPPSAPTAETEASEPGVDGDADELEDEPVPEELDEEQQAALDNIMAEINADAPPSAPTAEAEEPEPGVDGDADELGVEPVPEELDDEQQAALDNIMAEINGDKDDSPKETAPDTAEQESETAPEELDDEQQAALDKIMAEINDDNDEKDGADSTSDVAEAPADPEKKTSSEELDEEQEAALNSIMAEINGGKEESPEGPESKAPEPASEDEDSSEALDDEQQAALSKSMSEINGDASGNTPEPEAADPASEPEETDDKPQAAVDDSATDADSKSAESPPPVESEKSDTEGESDSDDLDDEQQAALEKIMAELNGGDAEPDSESDSEDAEPPTEISESTEPGKPSEDEQPSQETAQLSLEEFNDELNSLLSAAKDDSNASDSDNAPPTGSKAVSEDAAVEDKDSGDAPPSDNDSSKDYAILHEVKPDADSEPAPAAKKRPPKKAPKKKKPRYKVFLATAAAAAIVICLAGGAYWYYVLRGDQSFEPGQMKVAVAITPDTPVSPLPTAVERTNAERSRVPDATTIESQPAAPDVDHHVTTFASLSDEITAAREHVLSKMEEVKDLKTYYEKGINTDREKVLRSTADARITSFKEARKHRQIELALRAMQRRSLYVAKLEIPIRELTSASEELLYLKRKTRMYETLTQGLIGLAIPEFKQEVSIIIRNLLKISNELSIDHIRMEVPTLESVWNTIQSAEPRKPKQRHQVQHARDKKISQEICQGNFERKYLLTTLTPEAAGCLVKWTGKDLYLNGLTRLSIDHAKILSQWPGEWLSLNGLKELPADAAQHLSQWKGKRLSLNGLTRLSKRATQHLSNWKGEQLEMVGLQSIGRWENYGTQLYLSEKLRRKLQVQ